MKKLSNHTLTKLTKFVHVMRKVLGSLKATDILANKESSCGYFVQGVLSEAVEVKSISKELMLELELDTNLLNAAETYIKDLSKQNTNEEFIHLNKYYLVKFAQYLCGIDCNGLAYRHAVNGLLKATSKKDKTFCINLARSFYPYWKKAHKSLDGSDQEQIVELGFDDKKFTDLWSNLDYIFLSASEDWTLSTYSNAMLAVGTSEKEIDARTKLAKLILNELRSLSQTDEPYRFAVDNIHSHLFNSKMKEYFLVVSREFYSFWKENMTGGEH